MLEERMVVRLRQEVIDEMKYFFKAEEELMFVEKFSDMFMNKDIKIIEIDNEYNVMIVEPEGGQSEAMLFETHTPSSNLIRVGDKDIRAFDKV